MVQRPLSRGNWLAGIALALLAGPALAPTASAQTEAPPPPWFEAGLETGLRSLWAEPPGAIAETAEPIDHGDVWAWTGDNAKFLGAEAEARQADASGDDGRPGQMRDFLLRMRDGPLVFKRWANTAEPVVVEDTPAGAELSNHLLTLRLDRGSLVLSAELEYHDGRDKAMAAWGPAQVLRGGQWTGLSQAPHTVTLDNGSGEVAVRIRYELPDLAATQSVWLDDAAVVHQSFTVERGHVEGVRLPLPDLTIRRTGLPEAAYGQAYWPQRGVGPVAKAPGSGAGDGQSLDWMMLLDPGTSDEFASGLLLRAAPGSAPSKLHLDTGGAGAAGGLRAAALSAGGGDAGFVVSHDAVLLDGVLTGHLERYGALAARLGDDGMAGVDPGLSYEYSETVLGLLQFARATGDEDAAKAAKDLFGDYLGFYKRGTQTRSLGAAVMTALLLADVTGDDAWHDTAKTLGAALHTYQVHGDAAEAGSVLNEPGGGPFLDSTVMAARAWGALAAATGSRDAAAWSKAAWGSLDADRDQVFIRGDRADDNEWSFKTGLILQGGAEVPPAVRWAARNHAWVVLRDLDAFEFRTSRYSAETNSETQAWMMLGLLADRGAEAGPWILDSEGYVPSWSPLPQGRWQVEAPWNGSYLWVERGWLAYVDGGLATREPGPHDSWRVVTGDDLVLAPSQTHSLAAGRYTFAWPAVTRPIPTDQALAGLPVEVAWAYDQANRTWLDWRPDDAGSTLAQVEPGQSVLVQLDGRGEFEAPRGEPAPASGWDLAAARAPSGSASPPMLVAGRVVAQFPHRLHGGAVHALQDGASVGEAWIGADGSYRLLVAAAPGSGDLAIEHWAPDGRLLATAGTLVEDPEYKRSDAPPAVVMLAVLVAALAAVIILAIAVRRATP
jgi:hypothetical protein